MLVLARRPMETIHIGDSIVVTLVRLGDSSVRIGIDAPAEMRVIRGELMSNDARPPLSGGKCASTD